MILSLYGKIESEKTRILAYFRQYNCESSVNSFKLKIDFECLLNTDYCSKYIGVCDFFQKIFFSNVQHITDLLYSRTILSTLHLTQT